MKLTCRDGDWRQHNNKSSIQYMNQIENDNYYNRSSAEATTRKEKPDFVFFLIIGE